MTRNLDMLPMLVMSLGVAFGADGIEKEKEKDLKALQGKWVVVSAIYRGKPVTKEELDEEKSECEFKEDAMVMRSGKEEDKHKFALDLSKKPKKIVTDYINPDEKNRKYEMIYEIENDELKVAFRKNGKPTPDSFEVKDEINIFVFKRKK